MASEVRLKDLSNAATTPAMDDYVLLDGDTNGVRKILSVNVHRIPAPPAVPSPPAQKDYLLRVATDGSLSWVENA